METIDMDGECGVVRGWKWMGVGCGSWMGVYVEWRMDVLDESRMEEPQTKTNMNSY